MSDEPAWESWLRQQFVPYLMRSAAGEVRPVDAVAHALARLIGSPGALTHLATLAFLLDAGLEKLVCSDLPIFLSQLTPTTHRDDQETRGVARGRIAWARTLARRQLTRDPLLFVTSVARRGFANPELSLLRWLLGRVLAGIEQVSARLRTTSLGTRADRWPAQLARLHHSAHEALRHIALRDLPELPPDSDAYRSTSGSRHEFIRAAAVALAHHDALLPVPQPTRLAAVLATHALAPTDAPRRFELYFLINLADAVDRVWKAPRRDALIEPARQDVVTWSKSDWKLALRYDHGAPRGHYDRAMRHAFDLDGVLRPDLWLTLERQGRKTELYLDAKHSIDEGYLRRSAIKMLASVADRPGAFLSAGPCGVLLSLRTITRPPDLDSPLAYLDPSSCTEGGPLDQLIQTWLARAGAPV